MISNCTIFLMILLLSLPGFSKKTSPARFALLDQATSKYRNSKMVEIGLEKVVRSELTGKETKYKGTIYLSSGLFRMVNT